MTQSVRVGLLIAHAYGFYRDVVRGVISFANSQPDWLVQSPEVNDRTRSWLQGRNRPAGLIVALDTPALVELVAAFRGPVVNVSAVLPDVFYPTVRVDNASVATLAAEHFRELGFSAYGFVGTRNMHVSNEREAGFRAAVGMSRLQVYHDHPDRPFDSDAQFRSLEPGLNRWLSKLRKPVGILAPNDLWAAQVVTSCWSAGLTVPDQVAVLGVDNDDLFCEASRTPLSSIQLPAGLLGHRAAEVLRGLLAGQPPPSGPVLLPAIRLVARRSTDTLAVADPVAAAVARYIRNHTHEGLTVADVMATLPVSRRSIERRFRAVFGRSPAEEIRRVRVDHARRLLAETDLPIKLVAARAGFTDTRHLTDVFRDVVGQTPTEFRASLQTN